MTLPLLKIPVSLAVLLILVLAQLSLACYPNNMYDEEVYCGVVFEDFDRPGMKDFSQVDSLTTAHNVPCGYWILANQGVEFVGHNLRRNFCTR